MAEAGGKDPVEYISHHLGHWQVGSGMMAVNLDTVLFSLLAGGVMLFIAWLVARRITSGRPGGLQNMLEAVVEFVNGQIRAVFPIKDPFVGPMALTIFLWVIAMNAIDLIPVDFFPSLAGWIGGALGLDPKTIHLHALPTADLSVPFAMAVSVFVMTFIYNLRHRGLRGYLKHYFLHPYGKFAVPFNLLMNTVEELARPLSLALRLWGNFFAGDLIFMLIALFGFSIFVTPIQVALGWAWSWFETLEVLLQAFIFMLLSVVYLGMTVQEEEAH